MTYSLSRKAETDLIDIYFDGVRQFGQSQADAYHAKLEAVYQLLAAHPALARRRWEIDPPVRFHPFEAHLIVYEEQANGSIIIIRLRHWREDWIDDLFGTDD